MVGLTASDVVTADEAGRQVAWRWRIHPATSLHFALHRSRHAEVTVHNHPRWSTRWANHLRVPPEYDQSGAKLRGEIVVVDEYEGAVLDKEICDRIIPAMGDADVALLAHHGVRLIGDSISDALTRALALEARSRSAWQTEAIGGRAEALPESIRTALTAQMADTRYGEATFTALARREIKIDPSVLD